MNTFFVSPLKKSVFSDESDLRFAAPHHAYANTAALRYRAYERFADGSARLGTVILN